MEGQLQTTSSILSIWREQNGIAQLEAGISSKTVIIFSKMSDFPPESGLFRIILGFLGVLPRYAQVPKACCAEVRKACRDGCHRTGSSWDSCVWPKILDVPQIPQAFHNLRKFSWGTYDDIDSVGLLGVSDKPKCVCPTTRDGDVYHLWPFLCGLQFWNGCLQLMFFAVKPRRVFQLVSSLKMWLTSMVLCGPQNN